jgi:hypothetical protein
MLKKPTSIVLASFRPSTYPRGYAFEPSLAAALLDGLFEQPDGILALAPRGKFQPYFWHQPNFSAAC